MKTYHKKYLPAITEDFRETVASSCFNRSLNSEICASKRKFTAHVVIQL